MYTSRMVRTMASALTMTLVRTDAASARLLPVLQARDAGLLLEHPLAHERADVVHELLALVRTHHRRAPGRTGPRG